MGRSSAPTKDKDYLLWFVQVCRANVLGWETWIQNGVRDRDRELPQLFSKAQAESR